MITCSAGTPARAPFQGSLSRRCEDQTPSRQPSIPSLSIRRRLPQASLGRQMPDVVHNLPDLLVVQDPLRSGHPRRGNTVVDNPFQLPIAIPLDCGRSQQRNRRRHPIGKRHTGILSVQPVTDHTVMREILLPRMNVLAISGQRVRLRLPPNTDDPAVSDVIVTSVVCPGSTSVSIFSLRIKNP